MALFFKTFMLQHNSESLISVDETIVSKAGKSNLQEPNYLVFRFSTHFGGELRFGDRS